MGKTNIELNEKIKIIDKRKHSKASETYLNVEFNYNGNIWKGWIPIEYRRTGLFLEKEEEIIKYLNKVYDELNPKNYKNWLKEQEEFWKTKNAKVTKSFFDVLSKGNWTCVNCQLPANPNWARRIQDLKELGYTIATDTHRYCECCKSFNTSLIMLPIKRLNIEGNGYEMWSGNLRKRIVKVLGEIDVYENTKNSHCLPDHKFSEIRWDKDTKSENLDTMTDDEIKNKFQLLTNQRNQQKREVCRNCYQTGRRGVIFGIPFYYYGSEKWDNSIPKRGKEAEKGCYGCPWYDIDLWRRKLLEIIQKEKEENK